MHRSDNGYHIRRGFGADSLDSYSRLSWEIEEEFDIEMPNEDVEHSV